MRKFRLKKIKCIVLNGDFHYRSNRKSQKRSLKECSLEKYLIQ